MAQIFPRNIDNVLRLSAVLLGPLVLTGAVSGVWYYFSPSFTDVGYQPEQPVPFSHRMHAGELGLDCRYCHSTIEQSAHAAIPPTDTCMNCHKVVAADRPSTEPIRNSHATGEPIPWVRVHMLPDYTYFDHSVHLAAGVGCVSCHGRVDQMEVVAQEEPLSMGWCLDCHRNPEPHLRPRDEVTNMAFDVDGYDPTSDPSRTRPLTPPEHCSGCHR